MNSYIPQRFVDAAAVLLGFANLVIGALLSIAGLFSLLAILAFLSNVSSILQVLIVIACIVAIGVPIMTLGSNMKFLGGGPTSHLIKANIGNTLCCLGWVIVFS